MRISLLVNSYLYTIKKNLLYVATESYYKSTGEFGKVEYEELASLLSNIKGRFLLSYNDCSLVRELYKNFKRRVSKEIEYTLGKNSSGKNKKVKEMIITNY